VETALPENLVGGTLSPAEARDIAEDAYICSFPIVDGYRIQYAYFVDPNNREFKAPWNQIRNVPRVFAPEDTAIQTANSDTSYSFAGLDLMARSPSSTSVREKTSMRRILRLN
jgi:hypothetical protein